MKIHRGLNNLPQIKDAVLTIGSFDGVHKGHRRILSEITKLARRTGGESVLMTFHPHPRQVIYPGDSELRLLNTLEEKIDLLADTGIDHLVIVPFTFEFSRMQPEEYVEKILVDNFHPKYIVIGYDHRFGLNRSGDVQFLRELGKIYDFKVEEIEQQEVEDLVVSSTKIRNAVANKEIIKANQLLGYNYRLTGKVIRGLRLGKRLGYPTANLAIEDKNKLVLPSGVYAVRIEIDNSGYKGMLYIGTRPTLDEENGMSIEINIFDYNRDIYGEKLKLEVLAYIRGDQKFEDLDELKKQIRDDERVIRRLFNRLDDDNEDLLFCAMVILNYNGLEHLKAYLPGIIKQSTENTKVIVADNASTDDSVNWIHTNHPGIEVIELDQNYGFAGGYNNALKKVNAKYYVLINSDLKPSDNFPELLLNTLENNSDVAAVQPKVLSLKSPDHFEYAGAAGGYMDSLGYPLCRGRLLETVEKDQGQYDDDREIFWATGAALAIRSKLFHKIGGFDPWYFAHQEEIDLCWRLKRAGYTIRVEPQAIVYHLGGGTLDYLSERKTFLNFKNSLANILKNVPFVKALILLVARVLLDGVAALYFLSKGQNNHIVAVLKAHLSFYSALGYLWKLKRRNNIRIRDVRCGPSRVHTGRYHGSIVWDYYIRGIRAFKDL